MKREGGEGPASWQGSRKLRNFLRFCQQRFTRSPPPSLEYRISNRINNYEISKERKKLEGKRGEKTLLFLPRHDSRCREGERATFSSFLDRLSLSLSRLCPLRGEKKKRKKKPLRSGMKQRRFITFLRRRRDRERERKRELLFSKENIPFARNSGFLITSGN